MTDYQSASQEAARTICAVLSDMNLTAPSAFYLDATGRNAWLVAALNPQGLGKSINAYTSKATLHQLSTALGGKPVVLSNHTGLRYGVLLSPLRKLPAKIDFPEAADRTRMIFGMRQDGRLAVAKRERINHMIVAGMTRSGKSTTLRLIAYQAMRAGELLAIADRDGRTFPMLTGSQSLFCEMGRTEDEYMTVLQRVNGEMDNRAAIFSQIAGYPDNLDEYNALALAVGKKTLPRIMVILDEFNSAVSLTGGPDGKLGLLAAQTAWRGLKYGISVVFAAQDFSKAIIGKIRDQVDLVICHRVQSIETARNLGVEAAARIPEHRPGRAITNRWGLVQTHYLDKSALIVRETQADLFMSEPERKVALRALRETDGKISRDVLTGFGLGRSEADRLMETWSARGWAEKDPQRANATYITAILADLLRNPAAPATGRSPSAAPATDSAAPATGFSALLASGAA